MEQSTRFRRERYGVRISEGQPTRRRSWRGRQARFENGAHGNVWGSIPHASATHTTGRLTGRGASVARKAIGRRHADGNRALSLPPNDGKSIRRVPGARSKRDGRREALGIETSAFRHFCRPRRNRRYASEYKPRTLSRVTVWRPGRSHKPASRVRFSGPLPTLPRYAAKDAARPVKPKPMRWRGSLPRRGTNTRM